MRSLIPPRTAAERGGAGRLAPLQPRAVVVARDPEIRDDWARALEAAGMSVARCVGPAVSCVLVRDGTRCPLLDDAGIALYHDAVLADVFEDHVRTVGTRAMVVAARDRCRVDGQHEPVMSRVIASPSG